jgi:DNA-binding CsgD family transcriptional regulator
MLKKQLAMENNNLPAGLMDRSIEIWSTGHDVYFLFDGKRIRYEDAPPSLIRKFKNDMAKHPEMIKILRLMGFISLRDQLKQYLKCRYGNFDHIPDFDHHGNSNPDHFNCGHRGHCPYEGKLCARIMVEHGYLTPREVEIVKLVGCDLPDKQISGILRMSPNTLKNHKVNIMQKSGLHSQVGIAVFAVQHNLL